MIHVWAIIRLERFHDQSNYRVLSVRVMRLKPFVVHIGLPEGIHLLSAKLRVYISSTFFIPLNIEENIIYSISEAFHKLQRFLFTDETAL